MVSVMILIFIVVFIVIGNSEPSKMAFAVAAANPVVRQRLGEPIKRGFFTSGNIETSGPSGHADVAIPISGPKAKATIYAVAQKSAGLWRFETLEIAFGEGSQRLSLKEASNPPDQ